MYSLALKKFGMPGQNLLIAYLFQHNTVKMAIGLFDIIKCNLAIKIQKKKNYLSQTVCDKV